MLKNCLSWLLLCFVIAVLSNAEDPPVSRIGPFDFADEDGYLSPEQARKGPEGNLFEGDIQISSKFVGEAGTARAPWPGAVIPYRFDCSVENIPSAIEATKAAIREWESKTCIRFVEKRPEDKAFLEFFRSAGCWATFVGYRKNTKTQISIGKGCDYKHVMVHELGHVIGFWHEQSRKDRDSYVTLNLNNVYPALRYNFNKVSEQTNNFGEPYDYASIMHYPWNAFAIDRRVNTINPIRSTSKTPYRRLSESDASQAKRMYKCSDISRARAGDLSDMTTARETAGNLVSSKCVDAHENCKVWAGRGYCDTNGDLMLQMCRKSCNNCGPCEESLTECEAWAYYGYCTILHHFMLRNCKVSCMVCHPEPTTAPTTRAPPTRAPTTETLITEALITEALITKAPITKATTTPEPIPEGGIRKPNRKYKGTKCADRSTTCPAWAKEGRCTTDQWVKRNCLSACKRYDICDYTPIKPIGECTSPFGIGWDFKIPDRNFYGTSTFYPGSGWSAPASMGRLYRTDDHGRKRIGAWCAHPGKTNQYLEINLGSRKTITAVATQGSYSNSYGFILTDTCQFALPSSKWRYILMSVVF